MEENADNKVQDANKYTNRRQHPFFKFKNNNIFLKEAKKIGSVV